MKLMKYLMPCCIAVFALPHVVAEAGHLKSIKDHGPTRLRKGAANKTSTERGHNTSVPHILKALYINLDRSVDRRAHMESMLASWSIPHERVVAKPESMEALLNASNTTYQRILSQGLGKDLKQERVKGDRIWWVWVANYISHVLAIQSMEPAGSPASFASNDAFLLMEDDASCPDNLQARMGELAPFLPDDWDVLKVGWFNLGEAWGIPKVNNFLTQREAKDTVNQQILNVSEPFRATTACDTANGCKELFNMGMHAYLIKAQSVDRLLSFLKRRPILSIDAAIRSEANSLNVYATKTPICDTSEDSDKSEIRISAEDHGRFKEVEGKWQKVQRS